MKRPVTFRIRTVVLFFNLILIVVIILGGFFLTKRLTEAMTVRQTELILLSQGMVLSQVILDEMRNALGANQSEYGRPIDVGDYRPGLTQEQKETLTQDPVQTRLDPLFSSPLEYPDSWEKENAPAPDPLAANIGETVTPLLLAARESTLTGIRLLDWQGIVVGSTSGGIGSSLAHWEEVGIALNKGQMASRIYQRPDTPEIDEAEPRRLYRVHVALPLMLDDRCVGALALIREPLNIPIAELESLRGYILLGMGVLLGLVVFFAVMTALTISLPVGRLLKRIERFARGDRNSLMPLERPVTNEMDRLSRGFVSMATALEDRSDYILTFARELSHAFKPSLATIQMRLEFLDDDENGGISPEERRRHLEIIRQETARLEQKTNRALEWARADAALPSGANVDVNRLLSEIADRYRSHDIRLGEDLDGHVSRAAIAEEDLEKIIVNLIENSVQHGGAEVGIKLTTRRLGNRNVEIEVADDGPGISPANRDRIFKTFFTTAAEHGGTGLGLSIVRSLVKAHHGTIRLETESGHGTIFKIVLPAA